MRPPIRRGVRSLLSCLSLVVAIAGCGGDDVGPADTGPADAGPSDTGPSDTGIPTTNEEHEAMLGGLGFSTDLGQRTSADGEDLPDSWHPLRTRYAAFDPKLEIYSAGMLVDGSREWLVDDGAADYGSLSVRSNPDPAWAEAAYKGGVAADVDGDGLDEIFVVYVTTSDALRYILIDPNDDAAPVMGELAASVDASSLHLYAQPSLAAGDLDGDGEDEIALGMGQLYLLDDVGGALSVRTKAYPDFNEVFVAIGDVDDDPRDELVVTHAESGTRLKGYYEIVDGTAIDAPTHEGELVVTDTGLLDHAFAETRVAIGDVDGDHLGEIIFHGRRNSDSRWMVFILDFDPSSPADPWSMRSMLHHVHTSGEVPWTLATVDYDGDAVDEIFAWNQIFALDTDGVPAIVAYLPTHPRAIAGDVDGDGREDLLLAQRGGVWVHGLDSLDRFVEKHAFLGSAPHHSLVVVPCNVDEDSAMVRYDGEHELLFTEPQLVTVMGSPPYHDGVGQDVSVTTATFGQTSGSTITREQSLGFSVGFSVGFSFEDPLFSSGFSAKTSFESAFDFHASQSSTVETYHSYTTAPGQDKVVFTATPFDVYYYTVVSSPDGDDIGRTVTVNLPRSPQMQGTSIEFFNAHNGGAQDVDEAILGHVLGDPWSYPTIEERDTILTEAERSTPGYARLWNGPIRVDESGSNSLGLSTSSGSARGASMDFSVTFEFETTTPGGATFGSSVGFHYGHSYEFSTEEGAFYEGTVGAIPGAAYAEHAYCYGLMVYPRSTAGQRFVVVDWWTQRECAVGSEGPE